MKPPKVKMPPGVLRRLMGAIANFLRSPVGGKARWMLATLLCLMVGINTMNVANSYVGRYFMSAIESRNHDDFIRFAWLYLAVFGGSTLIGVWFRFTEERLGLLWRDWLTRRTTSIYIERRLYLAQEGEESLSNPDQRMTEDVRQLTTSTLSFVLMMLNAILTVFSFSGVLWTISPMLFLIALFYALAGSALTIWLGRPLIRLNYQQSDFEADFRSELIKLRDGIGSQGTGEEMLKDRINGRIDQLVCNLKRIIGVNRNLGFFTSGYNYLIQLIPVLVVAPMFISREVEFGVIGQSAMAFATLLGAFSLVITQFQAISSYASVVARLEEFVKYAERSDAPVGKQ